METARMPAPRTDLDHHERMPTTSRAVESAVDAYATRVLKCKSPPEACVDESLGPYVTSLLRCSLDGNDVSDVTNIPEFESLVELLEEHCSLSAELAQGALQTIATAVRTGIVEEPLGKRSEYRKPYKSKLDEFAFDMDPALLWGNVKNEEETNGEMYPSIPLETESQALATELKSFGTPLKPDRLIPVDLLGVLDDPSTPAAKVAPANPTQEAFPPLGISTVTAKKGAIPKGKKASKKKAEDLAAALFRPSRARQNSIDGDPSAKSPKLKSISAPTSGALGFSLECSSTPTYRAPESNQVFQRQWDSAVEILLSMNPDLSEEAAAEAALVANTDVNVAQYVIDGALSASPVCRHMLNDGCYRSDCQFSHDVEGHTCLFWLRGRCGKGSSCRFLHGFSEKLLEGMNQEVYQEKKDDGTASSAPIAIASGAKSKPVPIATTNLVSHNMRAAFSAPQHEISPFASFLSSSHKSASSGFEGLHSMAFSTRSSSQGGNLLSQSWGEASPLESAVDAYQFDLSNDAGSGAEEGFSFATIASKGYSRASFSSPLMPPTDPSKQTKALVAPGGSPPTTLKVKSVKIPQDLWNPHVNRNSGVFHIQDPLDRYKEVASSVTRDDVIDLHYQSTKTFAIVLATVLPEKLLDHGDVWVVTGSGHHVSRNTHQKGGGALETAVLSWLTAEGYDFSRGRDRNGHGGAVLVKRK